MDFKNGKPDADALMNPTKRLKDEEAGVLNEILKASHQKEVIDKDLNGDKAKSLLQPCSFTVTHIHRKKTHLEYGKAKGKKRNVKRTKCSCYLEKSFLDTPSSNTGASRSISASQQ